MTYRCTDLENGFYHVFNRGVNKQKIFYDDDDRYFFINLCKKAIEKFDLTFLAFCLMGNHYHLFVYTQHANLSKAMKYINQKFSIFYISKYSDLKKCGHTFSGPYGRKIVQNELYARDLLSYIHINPYKDGFVKHPSDYFWSSYNIYEGKKDRFQFINTKILSDKFQKFKTSSKNIAIIDEATLNWNPDDHTIHGNVIGNIDFAKKIYNSQILKIDSNKLNNLINSETMSKFLDTMQLKKNLDRKIRTYCLLQWTELESTDLEAKFRIKASNARQIKYRIKKELSENSDVISEVIKEVREKFHLS